MQRYSMNTSLKNARIFEDDSLDEEPVNIQVKKEPVKPGYPDEQQDIPSDIKNIKIKTEKQTTYYEDFSGDTENSSDSNTRPIYESKYTINVKKENENSKDLLEESYLDNIPEEKWNTPSKNVKKEFPTEDSNPSPFNKELFKHFNLGEGYANSEPNTLKPETRKSAKRSVFSRLSPYKKHTPIEEPSKPETRQSVKKRLGPIPSTDNPKKREKPEQETDPAILARRQKQIDFGKNTIGYDNYIRTIPKDKRKREDAHTPDKNVKYSRRGWDGLIKQWRLKLHKYDPEDS